MSEREQKQIRIRRAAAALSLACAMGISAERASAARALGLDISAWQGNISQTTWNNLRNVENREFVILRSSRGGTTGYYNQNDSDNSDGLNTFSQRYDDPYFIQNINRATTAGMYAGTYHFSRPDIVAGTLNSGGIPNNGTDEANHFIQMAGPWMRPGYLMPVHDLEAGDGIRTDNEMAQFTIDFGNQIYNVMGIRPAIYTNGNYAANILQTASASLRTQLLALYPTLWSARWPNQADPNSIDVHNAQPKDTYSAIYGPWDDAGVTHPWTFWQYASTLRLNSYNNGGSNLDADVVNGGTEFLKDQLIPAVWMNNSSGDWTTLSNWNSGQPVSLPVPGAGQVAPVGTLTLPTPRLPGAAGSGVTAGSNDTVILDRPSANITVTHASGTTNIRKLYMRETLNITGGSFTINYVPAADSTPISAQFSGPVTMSGSAALSVHTLQVDAGQTFTISGGTFTFNKVNQLRGTTGAKILLNGDATFAPLSNATATLVNSGTSGNNASLDLGAGTRVLTVNDGTSTIDLDVQVPITNGSLTKEGLGTMKLSAANTLTGAVLVNRGILQLAAANNVSTTSGVTTGMTATTTGSAGAGYGGTVQLTGGISVGVPLAIGGAGIIGVGVNPPGVVAPGFTGALDSASGINTWSGTVTLNGTGTSGTDPLINQVSAAAGSTLVLSGAINDGPATATLAKSGDGDLVLTGASPNTYTNLTRLYGGRIIIEKNAALGAGNVANGVAGNTFQLAGSNSTIAFRAPASSPSGFTYSTNEWIHLDGNGASGFGQLDNLSGNNTFAGSIGLNGTGATPVSSIGVTSGSLTITGGIWARSGTPSATRILNKIGAGTLILTGDSNGASPNSADTALVASTLNVNAGTLEVRSPNATTTNLPGMTSWYVGSGATLRVGSGLLATTTLDVNLGGNLTLPAGGTAKTVRATNLAASGKIDLADHEMIVDYTSGSPRGSWNGSAYTGLIGTILAGRNGGAWNGNGIITSMSAAAGAGAMTTLGVAEASSALSLSGGATATWQGQSVDATTVLIKYTYAGDADLSGTLDADDYFRIDAGYSAQATGFENGDFNYDGKINADDYFLLDVNYHRSAGALLAAPPAGVSSVPEPASITLLGLSALSLGRRRSHR